MKAVALTSSTLIQREWGKLSSWLSWLACYREINYPLAHLLYSIYFICSPQYLLNITISGKVSSFTSLSAMEMWLLIVWLVKYNMKYEVNIQQIETRYSIIPAFYFPLCCKSCISQYRHWEEKTLSTSWNMLAVGNTWYDSKCYVTISFKIQIFYLVREFLKTQDVRKEVKYQVSKGRWNITPCRKTLLSSGSKQLKNFRKSQKMTKFRPNSLDSSIPYYI